MTVVQPREQRRGHQGGSSCRRLARRSLLMGAALLGAAPAATRSWAQSWPTKPVKIIVPFAPGGPADNYARFLGRELREMLGQTFVVEDGRAGSISAPTRWQIAPDGYTLLMMSNTHTVNESLIPNKPYVLPRDLVGVAPMNYSDLVLVAHPSVKANKLKEFLALAESNPGKLNYASSGPGTPYHMAGELFKEMAVCTSCTFRTAEVPAPGPTSSADRSI